MPSEIICDPAKGDIAEFRITTDVGTEHKTISMLVYDSVNSPQAILLVSQKIPPELEISATDVLRQGKFANVAIHLRQRTRSQAVA